MASLDPSKNHGNTCLALDVSTWADVHCPATPRGGTIGPSGFLVPFPSVKELCSETGVK